MEIDFRMGQKFVIPFPDGSVYEGSCSDDAKPHGPGRLKAKNGNTFTGEFTRGTASNGKMTFVENSNQVAAYEGQLNYGAFEGEGILTFNTGEELKGYFEKGTFVKGKIKFKGRDCFEGKTDCGNTINGAGVFTRGNGDVCSGNFCMGDLEGIGRIIFDNRDVF